MEESILAALQWLARHQNADGSWSVTQFHRNCGASGYRGDCAANHFEGNDQFDSGITALAVLAFLGAGHTPAARELVSPDDESAGELGAVLGAARAATYGDVVRKGVKHLLRSQGSSGMIGPEVDRAIYNHLIATLALSECYGITRAPVLRSPVARAVAHAVKARSPRLGWRYAFQAPEADSSVTGWAVMALRSAETAGIPVEHSFHDEVARWFEALTVKAIIEPGLLRAASSPDGESHWLTAYSRPEDAGKLVTVPGLNDDYYFTPASTAIMVMAQRLMGRPPSSKGEKALQTVLAFPPEKWSPDDRSSWKQADFYYWYHATYALAQIAGADDERWRRWSQGVEAALLSTQNLGNARGECREGSWEPVDRWSCEGGRVYATAIAVLTLQVHFRLPRLLAQKKDIPTLQLR